MPRKYSINASPRAKRNIQELVWQQYQKTIPNSLRTHTSNQSQEGSTLNSKNSITDYKLCPEPKLVPRGAVGIQLSSVCEEPSVQNKNHALLKSTLHFESKEHDAASEPVSKGTSPSTSLSVVDKGKDEATVVKSEASLQELQSEEFYSSSASEIECKMQTNESSSNGLTESSVRDRHPQNHLEKDGSTTTPASVVLTEPDIIDSHFENWLRAQDQDLNVYKEPLSSLLTNDPIMDNSNWSSLRAAVDRAAQDPYSYVCPLPQNKSSKPILMYPFSGSEIPHKHADAFEKVVDTLQANIEKYSQTNGIEVHYELWMCGMSKTDCSPSIVVICKKDFLADVESILSRPYVLKLCNLVAPLSILRKLRFHDRLRFSYPKAQGPQFKLYFCPRDTVPAFRLQAKFGKLEMTASIENADAPYSWMWPGSKVVIDQDRISTLTCFLRIGSHVFGLTTAHGFRKLPSSEFMVDKGQIKFDSTDINESKAYEQSNAMVSQIPCSVIFPPSQDLNLAVISDLDWALLKVEQEYFNLASKRLSTEDMPESMQLSDIASFTRPRIASEVVIYTSIGSQIKRGILLPGNTYRAVSSGASKVCYWSVAPHQSHEFLPGDSGSLVVNSSTNKVYGYIVSINTFGFAQIVPLSNVIGQMQSVFEFGRIRLGVQDFIKPWDPKEPPNVKYIPRRIDEHSTSSPIRFPPRAHLSKADDKDQNKYQKPRFEEIFVDSESGSVSTSSSLKSPMTSSLGPYKPVSTPSGTGSAWESGQGSLPSGRKSVWPTSTSLGSGSGLSSSSSGSGRRSGKLSSASVSASASTYKSPSTTSTSTYTSTSTSTSLGSGSGSGSVWGSKYGSSSSSSSASYYPASSRYAETNKRY